MSASKIDFFIGDKPIGAVEVLDHLNHQSVMLTGTVPNLVDYNGLPISAAQLLEELRVDEVMANGVDLGLADVYPFNTDAFMALQMVVAAGGEMDNRLAGFAASLFEEVGLASEDIDFGDV